MQYAKEKKFVARPDTGIGEEMGFVGLSGEYLRSGYTSVDNVFLTDYLPNADAVDVKIYLLGLAIASSGASDDENTLDKMSLLLRLDKERVTQGFRYWESKGLVRLTATAPFSVKYLSVKAPVRVGARRDPAKYADFNEEVQRIFPDRVVVPNEYEAYYSVIEESKMDLNAVLLVLQYCKDAGKTSTPYVLAVVTNMANDGYRTVKQVSERINELESNSEDIRQIFSALGVKRSADLDDRQLFLTWTKKQGYRLDAILTAARSLKKRGGMDRLRDLMEELFRAGARTAEEVNSYLVSRDALKDLAINVTKSLGAFYGSTEPLIENYLQPWLNMGFDEEGISALAKFCFLRNVKSFDGLSVYVEACYKNGVISGNGIKAFIERETALDEDIKRIFAETDRMDIVTETHRKAYRAWTSWGYGYDAIAEVARSCADTAFPFRSMNRILADLRRENVFDVDGVKKYLAGNKPSGGKKKEDDYLKHEYTKEQLDSVVKKLEDLDDDWGD